MDRLVVSAELFELSVRGLLHAEADWLLGAMKGFYKPVMPVDPGLPFGTAVAFLWRDHRTDLMRHLATYIDRLRLTSPLLETWTGPRITLDDLLRGLPTALPTWLGDDDATSLIAAIVGQLPQRLAEDPNEP